jgi:hypothetical protein
MKRRHLLRITRRFGALALLAGIGSACHDANNVTGLRPNQPTAVPVPTATPTPPPASLSNISGSWHGTMDARGCSGQIPASAEFRQSGTSVTGTVKQVGCIETFSELDFSGTYVNGKLTGTTTGPDFPGTMTGELSGTTLQLRPYTSNGFLLGTITLTH